MCELFQLPIALHEDYPFSNVRNKKCRDFQLIICPESLEAVQTSVFGQTAFPDEAGEAPSRVPASHVLLSNEIGLWEASTASPMDRKKGFRIDRYGEVDISIFQHAVSRKGFNA
jgi:hypothetical protein